MLQRVLPSIAALVLVFVQAGLGGIVVAGELEATLVTLHFATAMTLLGVLVNITANSFCYVKLPLKGPSIAGSACATPARPLKASRTFSASARRAPRTGEILRCALRSIICCRIRS